MNQELLAIRNTMVIGSFLIMVVRESRRWLRRRRARR
jgi:hypothetical protein